MTLFKQAGVVQRIVGFAILFGVALGFNRGLQALGTPKDIAIGLAFLPTAALFVWNQRSKEDQFLGLAPPVVALAVSFSLGGFAQDKPGALYEGMYLAGIIGMTLSLGWTMWFLLYLGGRARGK